MTIEVAVACNSKQTMRMVPGAWSGVFYAQKDHKRDPYVRYIVLGEFISYTNLKKYWDSAE